MGAVWSAEPVLEDTEKKSEDVSTVESEKIEKESDLTQSILIIDNKGNEMPKYSDVVKQAEINENKKNESEKESKNLDESKSESTTFTTRYPNLTSEEIIMRINMNIVNFHKRMKQKRLEDLAKEKEAAKFNIKRLIKKMEKKLKFIKPKFIKPKKSEDEETKERKRSKKLKHKKKAKISKARKQRRNKKQFINAVDDDEDIEVFKLEDFINDSSCADSESRPDNLNIEKQKKKTSEKSTNTKLIDCVAINLEDDQSVQAIHDMDPRKILSIEQILNDQITECDAYINNISYLGYRLHCPKLKSTRCVGNDFSNTVITGENSCLIRIENFMPLTPATEDGGQLTNICFSHPIYKMLIYDVSGQYNPKKPSNCHQIFSDFKISNESCVVAEFDGCTGSIKSALSKYKYLPNSWIKTFNLPYQHINFSDSDLEYVTITGNFTTGKKYLIKYWTYNYGLIDASNIDDTKLMYQI